MNRTVTFTLLAAVTAAALAGPACAAEITVNLAGKDPKAIRADVEKAAWAVCKDAYREEFTAPSVMSGCVRDSVASAMADVSKAHAWAGTNGVLTEMASNSAAPLSGK